MHSISFRLTAYRSEKQLRKLVKQEDDFVLFKRSLRQAIAYYSTTADRSRATPFRSVRRTNPLAAEGNGGVLGAMDRLNRCAALTPHHELPCP